MAKSLALSKRRPLTPNPSPARGEGRRAHSRRPELEELEERISPMKLA